MRARDRFLSLNHLYRVGDSGGKPVARLGERLFRKVDIALGDSDLLGCRLKVQQRGANVRVDLGVQIVSAGLAAFASSWASRLKNVPVNRCRR